MRGRVKIGTVVLLVAFLSQDQVQAQVSKAEPLDLVREAYLATQSSLRSGSGEAIFESYARPLHSEQWQLRVRAKCRIWFRDSKYHIRLVYDKDEDRNLKSRVIINDGSALLTNCRSPRLMPLGEEGAIYDANTNANTPVSAAFPFNPAKLPDAFLSIEALVKTPDLHLEVKRVGENLCRGTFQAGNDHSRFEAAARDGYNVSSWQAFSTGSVKPVQSHTGVWLRDMDSWYVKSVTIDFNPAKAPSTREVLSYSKFVVNPSVDDSYFKFEALELKVGARILDQRREAKELIYYNTVKNPTDQAKLDKLSDAVSSLSKTEFPSLALRSSWLWYTLIIAAVLLSGVGCVLLWRRSSRTPS
jgi:hypothetical protein